MSMTTVTYVVEVTQLTEQVPTNERKRTHISCSLMSFGLPMSTRPGSTFLVETTQIVPLMVRLMFLCVNFEP